MKIKIKDLIVKDSKNYDFLIEKMGKKTGKVHLREHIVDHDRDLYIKVRCISDIKKTYYYLNLINIDEVCTISSVKNLIETSYFNYIFNISDHIKNELINSIFECQNKIYYLEKQKEQMELFKKGLMQKIFSQELKFKGVDGNYFKSWERKALNNITKIYDGTHSTPNYVKQGIPFYSVEHVTANQFDKTKYISENVFDKENKRVKLERNDILMTRMGDIGTSKLIDWDVQASFYVSLSLIKKSESFISGFINQQIMSEEFQKQLYMKTLHIAFPKKINLREIGDCFVFLPQIKEQTKISSFLSAIDTKIELLDKRTNTMKLLKKGLIQKMFI